MKGDHPVSGSGWTELNWGWIEKKMPSCDKNASLSVCAACTSSLHLQISSQVDLLWVSQFDWCIFLGLSRLQSFKSNFNLFLVKTVRAALIQTLHSNGSSDLPAAITLKPISPECAAHMAPRHDRDRLQVCVCPRHILAGCFYHISRNGLEQEASVVKQRRQVELCEGETNEPLQIGWICCQDFTSRLLEQLTQVDGKRSNERQHTSSGWFVIILSSITALVSKSRGQSNRKHQLQHKHQLKY